MKINRLGMHAGIWTTVLALLLMSIMPVIAEEPPEGVPVTSPLSGNVTIDGEVAPDGSEVRVLVGYETEPRATGVGTVFGGGGRYEILLIGDGEDVGLLLRFQVRKPETADWIYAATVPADPRFARYDPQTFDLTAPAAKYTVDTLLADPVGATSAILRGELGGIVPEKNVTVWFQWGETTAYGNETTRQPMALPGYFSFPLTDLEPGTTYHFRAVATGVDGTIFGANSTFTTLTLPPAVTTNEADFITAHSAILHGTLENLGGHPDVEVSFEWGTTSGDLDQATDPVAMTSTGAFSAPLGDLKPGSTYYFRAKAEGSVVYGAERSFTTLTEPPVVITLDAIDVTGESATLRAELDDMGGAPDVSVSFEYGTDRNYLDRTTAEQVLTLPGIATVHLGGLAASTTYYFRAKAVNDAGAGYGEVRTFTTATVLEAIVVTPAAPTIPLGKTVDFKAEGIYSDDSRADLTDLVTWTSSDTGVATIDDGGEAESLGVGTTTITAALGDVSGTSTLEVGERRFVSLVITPDNPSIGAGETIQFTATAHYSDGSTEDRTEDSTWQSSNTTVATIVSDGGADHGKATAEAAGTTIITAIDGDNRNTTILRVEAATLEEIEIDEIAEGLLPLVAGGTLQLGVTGTYSDGSTADLTEGSIWFSSNPAVATISRTGLVTAVTPGEVTITATHRGQRDSIELTVTEPLLESITVTPAAPTITVGDTLQFTATGTYTDGSTKDITAEVGWGSDDVEVATIDTGLATGHTPGEVTITATLRDISSDDTGESATLTVTAAQLVSIKVTPDEASIALGETQDFTATGTYTGGITGITANITDTVTWASDAPTVATIDDEGLATSADVGEANITATLGDISSEDTGESATLTVTAAQLVSIEVTPDGKSIALGLTLQFTATGTYTDDSEADITNTVAWASDNHAVATIAAGGLASSVDVGDANITATLDGIPSPPATLTVTAAQLVSIAVTPTTAEVVAGRNMQFTATGTYTDGTTPNITEDVEWSSSDTAVASIDDNRLATGHTPGVVTITATLGDISSDDTDDSATLTVSEAQLVSVSVTPVDSTIVLDTTQQFRAMGTYSDGSRVDVTDDATWESSDETKATISATGLATSVAAGTTVITAALNEVSGTSTLTVIEAQLVSIAITPETASVAAGETQPFTATGTYNDGSTPDITALVTWNSSDIAVARINAAGLATSHIPGHTYITATMDDVTSPPAKLTVNKAVLESIRITPVNPTLTFVSGDPPAQQFTATASDSDGSTRDVTTTATWTSSDTGVATIGPNTGLATTVAPVATTITATFDGKADSTTLTVLPDTVAPVVTLTHPATGLTLSEKRLTVSGNVDDVNAVTTVIVNGEAPIPLVLDTDGSFSRGVILKAGNNTILVIAVDDPAGNIGTSGTRTVEVDPLKPTITIIRPADGLLTGDDSLTVTGRVAGATTVTLMVNAISHTINISPQQDGAYWSFSKQVNLLEGDNMITASAYATGHEGDADYRGTSGTRTVTLDTTPPVVTLTSPVDESVVSSPGIEVSGTIDDPDVAVAWLTLNREAPLVIRVVDGDFSQKLTLRPGRNTIVVVAIDDVGNTSSSTVSVTFDNIRPEVTVTEPVNRLLTNIAAQTVTGRINDPAIMTATLLVNDTLQAISVAPDGSFNYMVILEAGENTIEVTASDDADPPNVGTSGVITVTVDITPPVLTVGLSDPADSIFIVVSSDEALVAPPTLSINPDVPMTAVGVNTWVGIYDIPTDADYVVTVTGEDRAGNTATRTASFTLETITVDGVTPTTVDTATTTLEVETHGVVEDADITVTQHIENPSGNAGNPEGAPLEAGAFLEIHASPELRDNLDRIYVRVDYDPAELPEGTDESSLRLYLWDVTRGIWELVPDSGVNTAEHYIFGTVTHLSRFGGFGAPVTRYSLTVTVNPADSGTVSLDPPRPAEGYDAGTVVTLTATPASGYTFSHWSDDASGTARITMVTMDANKSVTAHFALIPPPRYTLTVTVAPPEGGAVTPSPLQPAAGYLSGTVVTLTATRAAGYEFDRWSGDASGTARSTMVTMDANKSVTAHFARVAVPRPPARYTLTVTVDPPEGGTVSLTPLQPAAGYLSGTAVTLTATPGTLWKFDRWSGDASGTVPTTTVTMTRDKSVTAHFAPVPVVPTPAEVAEAIGEIPAEEPVPEETIKHIEEMPLEEALEIAEGVSIERAAEITEGVGIQRAIELTERVSIERAVEITQEVSVERAAEIVDKVVIERAVAIIEGVSPDKAAEIIEEISRMEGTIDRAVEILEKVSLERATEIIERLSIETAVEIAKRLSIERASGILEKVSIERASVIIKGVPVERAMEILTLLEKVYPQRWELLPKPIFELADLLIEPLEVGIGEEVTISAEAANVGEITGKKLITLKVAEVVVETEEVELGPGETARVEFKVVKMEPGVYPVEIDGLIGEFTVVVPPAPTIEKVVPDSGIQGATIDVVITGEHFTGATAVSFGEGITVNIGVVSPTRIEANISIAADAEAGPRDVSVTTPAGTATLPGGFTVRDITPPMVVSTSPKAGAGRVPVDVKISATFSEGMDRATINAATFTLISDGTRIAGRVMYDPATRTATFIPHENLAYGTVYTATITTGARDLAGNGLAREFSWSFTTQPEPPDLAPIIEGVATVARVVFTIAVIVFAFLTRP